MGPGVLCFVALKGDVCMGKVDLPSFVQQVFGMAVEVFSGEAGWAIKVQVKGWEGESLVKEVEVCVALMKVSTLCGGG